MARTRDALCHPAEKHHLRLQPKSPRTCCYFGLIFVWVTGRSSALRLHHCQGFHGEKTVRWCCLVLSFLWPSGERSKGLQIIRLPLTLALNKDAVHLRVRDHCKHGQRWESVLSVLLPALKVWVPITTESHWLDHFVLTIDHIETVKVLVSSQHSAGNSKEVEIFRFLYVNFFSEFYKCISHRWSKSILMFLIDIGFVQVIFLQMLQIWFY